MGSLGDALVVRRSSFVVRRRSFVARLSPFVVRRWSLVGGHLGNSSFRNKAFEDALASFSDTLEDEPSYPIERPRETSDPYGVSPETFHNCSLANVVSLNVVPLSMGSPAWSHLRGSLTVVLLAWSP